MVLLVVVTFLLSNLSLETGRPASPGISMQPLSAAALEEERNEAEEEEDYGVFDEVKEVSPEDYVELEKTTSVAVEQFIEGSVKWRKKEKIS